MSPRDKIAKLEGLLARVTQRASASRAAAPSAQRVNGASAAELAGSTSSAVASGLGGTAAARPAHESTSARPSFPDGAMAPPNGAMAPPNGAMAPAPRIITPPTVISSIPPPLTSGWSEPPAVGAPGVTPVDLEPEMDVEVSTEVVEVEIDLDEPTIATAESGAHAIAEAAAYGERGLLEEVEAAQAEIEAAQAEAEAAQAEVEAAQAEVEAAQAEAEAAHAEIHVAHADTQMELEDVSSEFGAGSPSVPPTYVPPANEIAEPAPSSSPRPIATETAEPYEEESVPRHTPPPESGKQVAAASIKPEPRMSSMPPSDGHTLIGGWREPGRALPREFALRSPAVRVPPPAPPPPPEVSVQPAAAASQGLGRASLAPEGGAPTAPPPSEAVVPFALPRPADAVIQSAPPSPQGPEQLLRTTPPRPSATGQAMHLDPSVTKADLPADARVAAVEGAAAAFAPSSFGELLDASLGL